MRPWLGGGGSVVSWLMASLVLDQLDVEEANVFRVALDERPALFDVFTHQDREDLVGAQRVIDAYLEKHALVGIHRGGPQLFGVHLAKALVALDAIFRQLAAALKTSRDQAF